MSIAKKVLIIALLPMLAFFFQSWRFLETALNEQSLTLDMHAHFCALNSTSALVHELQKERGISSLYATGGADPASLQSQRESTDQAVKKFQEDLESAAFKDSIIQAAKEPIRALESLRSSTDQKSDPAEIRKNYTNMIRKELKVYIAAINGKTTRGVGKGWTSLALLEDAKEASGQLRALMASLAKRNTPVSMSELKQLQSLFARIGGNLESPGLALCSKAKEKLKEAESHPLKIETESIFWDFVEHANEGNFGLDGMHVFNTMTKRIDMLNAILQTESNSGINKLKKATEEGAVSVQIGFAVTITTSIILLGLLIWIFRDLRQGFSKLESLVDQVAKGELPDVDSTHSGNELLRLQSRIGDMILVLKGLIRDMSHMSKEHMDGDIDVLMPVEKYHGAYSNMASGVNEMVLGHIAVKRKAMACIEEFGKGNFDAELEKFPGKKAFINRTIEQVRMNLKALISDTNELSKSAVAGQLSKRADVHRHLGDFRLIVQGINDTLDAVIHPVNEAANVLEKVAARDLTVRMYGEYQGDLNRIKVSLNQAVDNLDIALVHVAESTGQVASASQQISSGSQTLAQGANEQASSLEEVTSSLEEMSSKTHQNADHALQAQRLATEADQKAHHGLEAMQQMSTAIGRIQSGSNDTAKIIKTIDEIAMQTNLLALNAAVEAARAGEAGRGFAVVAEEVRNLASRSAQAAKNTADRISESVRFANDGVEIAKTVAKSFEEIAHSNSKVNQLISDIAKASQEQSSGIQALTQSVSQMDQVTQANAANSEESASAAEELSSQAEELMAMVNGFRISGNTKKATLQLPSHSASESKQYLLE